MSTNTAISFLLPALFLINSRSYSVLYFSCMYILSSVSVSAYAHV